MQKLCETSPFLTFQKYNPFFVTSQFYVYNTVCSNPCILLWGIAVTFNECKHVWITCDGRFHSAVTVPES